MMKAAIIGAGFCGLALAWHTLNRFPSVDLTIFDAKPLGKGTSGIAAGLLHPFVGAHAKLNWRGHEGVAATRELLHVASQALGKAVTASEAGILRLALTEKQKSDFQLCAHLHPRDVQWLEIKECQSLAPGCARAPGLWIKQGLTVYSSLYLQGLWQACVQRGAVLEQKKIESLSALQGFDLILVAAGAATHRLPELAHLPLKIMKGQVLELAWPPHIPPLRHPLNSQVYLLMTENQTSCLAGATYEKGSESEEVDIEVAQADILPKIQELFPPLQDASLLACHAGLRVATPQRRPLATAISSSTWVLTGMGSKGLLYHALYAKELIQQINELL